MSTKKFAFLFVLGALLGLTLCHTAMGDNGLASDAECTTYCKTEYGQAKNPAEICTGGTYTAAAGNDPATCVCTGCTALPDTTTTTTTTTADPKNDGDKSAAVSSALVSSPAARWVGGAVLALTLLSTAL